MRGSVATLFTWDEEPPVCAPVLGTLGADNEVPPAPVRGITVGLGTGPVTVGRGVGCWLTTLVEVATAVGVGDLPGFGVGVETAGILVAVEVRTVVAVAVGTVVVPVGTGVAAVGTVVAVPVGTVVAAVGTVVATVGTVVAVAVAPAKVGVAVGEAAHWLTKIALVSIVTEPLRARALPSMPAPLFRLMLVSARMLPAKLVVVPRTAELPTCQNTLQADAPPVRTTEAALAVVSVLPI